MNKELLYYITNQAGSLSIQELLINFVVAMLAGAVIFLSYRFSHSGAVYSARFNVSLWMLAIVTTMVMCVIGNNVALSLGMVGALSIVRFRTAIKDARDTGYIFWSVAVGICCGVSDFVTALVGSTVIFLLLLVIGGVAANTRYLLIVRGNAEISEGVENTMGELFGGKARLCVRNAGRENIEYIYELSDRQVNRVGAGELNRKLFALSGVTDANLVGQNDEITA